MTSSVRFDAIKLPRSSMMGTALAAGTDVFKTTGAVVDVQQQSDFFLSLGQHDQAVTEYDLLLDALPPGHVLRQVAEEMRRRALEQAIAAATAQQAELADRI